MPRRCSICEHDERERIDRALVGRDASYRAIAGDYGLSESAVQRHASDHLPRALVRAREVGEAITAAELTAHLVGLYNRARRILDRAERSEDDRLALQAIREARGVLAVGLRSVEANEIERRIYELERRAER